MPVPSLLQLSTATAIRNVKYLNDIGSIPYALARPFLLKVESPEKLRSLEISSPHIIKDDVELWLEFIKRDIPKWEEYDLPEDPDCWYDVYCNLLERVQKSVEEDAEKLKMAFDGINSERAKHSARFVTDRRSLRLPQERPTVKQRYASYDRKMGGISPVFVSAARSGAASADPLGAPAWTFERPQLPRSESMPAAKKKNNIFAATKRNPVLAVPTKQLNNRASRVKQAPLSLIEEHRRPVEPVAAGSRKATPALIAPGRSKPKTSAFASSPVSMTSSLQEREARLRAVKSGNSASSKPSAISPIEPSSPLKVSSPEARNPVKSPSSSKQVSTVPIPAETKTQNQLPMSNYKLSSPGRGPTDEYSDGGAEPKAPSERAPRPMVMRKRPAPSIFIQPKRKKMS